MRACDEREFCREGVTQGTRFAMGFQPKVVLGGEDTSSAQDSHGYTRKQANATRNPRRTRIRKYSPIRHRRSADALQNSERFTRRGGTPNWGPQRKRVL